MSSSLSFLLLRHSLFIHLFTYVFFSRFSVFAISSFTLFFLSSHKSVIGETRRKEMTWCRREDEMDVTETGRCTVALAARRWLFTAESRL